MPCIVFWGAGLIIMSQKEKIYQGETKRILVFGASITYGSNDYAGGGWVVRLKKYFAQTGQFCHTFNLGISGETSTQILQRMEAEIKPRLSDKPEKRSLLLIGIPSNDTRIKGSLDANPEISEMDFKDNLEKFRQISERNTDGLVLIGIPRVDEKKTNPWQEVADFICWRNDVIARYNEIAKKYCDQKNIPFIDMLDVLSDSDLPDGLHPDASGHEKMYSRIKDFLVQKEFIKKI